jgi:hypothetical protein
MRYSHLNLLERPIFGNSLSLSILISFSVILLLLLHFKGEHVFTEHPTGEPIEGERNNSTGITLKGYLIPEGGNKINGAAIVIADLYDSSMEPVELISLEAGETYYETTNLQPGSYQVYATANAYHSSKVFEINASSGKTIWLNFTLVPIEIFTGYCIDEDGPVEDAIITLIKDNSTISTTMTSSQGLFKIILPPGQYYLMINKIGYITQEHDIQMHPGQRISKNFTIEKIKTEKEDSNTLLLVGIAGGLVSVVILGISIAWYFIKKRKKESQIPIKEDFHCIQCGNILKEGAGQCPSCGFELKKRCIECGSQNQFERTRCTKCGSPLDRQR